MLLSAPSPQGKQLFCNVVPPVSPESLARRRIGAGRNAIKRESSRLIASRYKR